MKQFWANFGAQLAAYGAAAAIIGLAAYLIWLKLFGSRTPSTVVKDTVDAAATIPGGVASLVGSTLLGQSAETYITNDQQRQQAAANLALVKASKVQAALPEEAW